MIIRKNVAFAAHITLNDRHNLTPTQTGRQRRNRKHPISKKVMTHFLDRLTGRPLREIGYITAYKIPPLVEADLEFIYSRPENGSRRSQARQYGAGTGSRLFGDSGQSGLC
jgi:hypothetical protein